MKVEQMGTAIKSGHQMGLVRQATKCALKRAGRGEGQGRGTKRTCTPEYCRCKAVGLLGPKQAHDT